LYIYDEIMIECKYCKNKISSRVLDEHETDCPELSPLQKLQKKIAIPTTKIESTELNQIGGHSSDNEDLVSLEGTPSRSNVALNGDIIKQSKANESPFSTIKTMVKSTSLNKERLSN